MGIYLNPRKMSFQMSINSAIYVDKTEMLQYLNTVINTQQRYVSVSRPRRFGKTMAANMISAYYDWKADSRELFVDKKIARCKRFAMSDDSVKWDMYLGQFDVIRLVMTDFMEDVKNVPEMLSQMTEEVVDEIKETYPDAKFGKSSALRNVMEKAYNHTNRQFVIVIDEWDAIFRVWKADKIGQEKYLDFLRDWLKDKEYVALAYMTGILPIKKYGKHSALNMFTEYSMMFPRQLARFMGFTEEEVKSLCDNYRMTYKDISNWYGGYVVSDWVPPDDRDGYRSGEHNGLKISIYSPLSVVEAMITGQIRNYWNKTETYEALAEYIRKDFDGLKEAVALLMDGSRLVIDTSTYQNDMTTFAGKDDVLSLLIHLGYLGYDDETSEVFIPNKEILDEFKASTKSSEWADTFRAYEASEELLQATWDRDAGKVAELLERSHDKAANKTYNDEAALSYAVQMAYYAAQKYYTLIPEADTGKGFADLICVPSPRHRDKPALVIELKYNRDADGAIAQIRRRNYPDRLEHYEGKILLVGINYDKDMSNESPGFKHHSCKIEEA